MNSCNNKIHGVAVLQLFYACSTSPLFLPSLESHREVVGEGRGAEIKGKVRPLVLNVLSEHYVQRKYATLQHQCL